MSDYEKITSLFTALNNCKDSEARLRFDPIADLFPLLTKSEQHESANAFYAQAQLNTDSAPHKFCYATFILSLNEFFHEKYETSLNLVNDAQKLFEALNDNLGIGYCLAIKGGIYRTLGNLDLALQTLWEGYELLKQAEVKSHYYLACTYNIGSIYLEMQHYDEAIQFFKNTYAESENVQDHFWTNYALHNLGKAFLLQNKYAEAKEFLDKAISNAQKSNSPLSISNALTEMANYHFQAEHFNEAEQLHKQALAIREEHKFIGAAVTNCIRLGEIYIKLAKPEQAIHVLNKGLKLANQIKVKPKLYQIHLLLSKIYEAKDEVKKSLFHYQHYHEIREEVEIEDNAKKLKNVQLIFEAEQTKKENVIIKKQKTEIEAKNIALQNTIDELTRTKIGKKAKALTLMIAIVFFIFEDFILHTVLKILPGDNYYLSLVVKMMIIFSLKPINGAIEHYLMHRILSKKKAENFTVGYPGQVLFPQSQA